MKYPSLSEFVQNNFDISNVDDITFDASLDIISSCIDVVYNADESWAAAISKERIERVVRDSKHKSI